MGCLASASRFSSSSYGVAELFVRVMAFLKNFKILDTSAGVGVDLKQAMKVKAEAKGK